MIRLVVCVACLLSMLGCATADAPPTAADEPPAATTGEYKITGVGVQSGTYALPGSAVTLKQALTTAGLADTRRGSITLIRTFGKTQAAVLENTPVRDLYAGKVEDLSIQPNDRISVSAD